MWYTIDYKRFVVLFLPVALRKPRVITWCQTLIAPLINVYDSWRIYRDGNLYNLAHNGQVCHLRKVLNDTFDIADRRIKIIDGNQFNRLYIYTPAEKKAKYLGVMRLRPASDYADTGLDFIVLVPRKLLFNETDMRAMIDFYRLASKKYDIYYE